MSIREHLKNAPSVVADTEPNWVVTGTAATRDLYVSTKAEFLRIKELIANAIDNNDKKHRLVLAKIATMANKSRSLINSRRQPDLCRWIKELNVELESLAETVPVNMPVGTKTSKRKLEKELSKLKREIKMLVTQERRDIVEAFFSSNLLQDRDSLARENNQLKLVNEQLQDKVSRLQNNLNEYHVKYAEILNLLTANQKALLKGLIVI